MISWLNNLKVVQKLTLLISILLVAVICVGGTGYYFLSKTNDSLNEMYNEKLVAVALVVENTAHARTIEADVYAIMLTTDANENKTILGDITNRDKAFDANITTVEKMPLSESLRTKIKAVRTDLDKYRSVRNKVLELANQNKTQKPICCLIEMLRYYPIPLQLNCEM